MDEKEFWELVSIGEEKPNLEFKESNPWVDKNFQAKITKAILGFSNLRDGGFIVIGFKEQDNGLHHPVGVQPDHLITYKQDHIARFVANYADPYVKFQLRVISTKGNSYIVIRVFEFDEIPVICKKQISSNEKKKPPLIREGAIYTRSHHMPQTIEVPGQVEMREIIDMASEKGIRKFYQRMYNAGIQLPSISAPSTSQNDEEKFKSQLRDII